jgi:hypothetical protein
LHRDCREAVAAPQAHPLANRGVASIRLSPLLPPFAHGGAQRRRPCRGTAGTAPGPQPQRWGNAVAFIFQFRGSGVKPGRHRRAAGCARAIDVDAVQRRLPSCRGSTRSNASSPASSSTTGHLPILRHEQHAARLLPATRAGIASPDEARLAVGVDPRGSDADRLQAAAVGGRPEGTGERRPPAAAEGTYAS